MLEAKIDGCQESNYLYPQFPCNKPAEKMVGWPARNEGPYRMCLGCADHSVKNRGASDLGPFKAEQVVVDYGPIEARILAHHQENSMDDVLAMAQADAAKEEAAPEDLLKRVEYFGKKQRDVMKQLAEAENQVELLKGQLRRIVEQDLPEVMDQAGMTSFTLEDGSKLTVKAFYSASIPEDRKDEAFDWLKENDFDGMIKADVKVSFGKGEFEIAQSFLQFIRGFNETVIQPEYKENVHWQTLRAFVKEQIEGGKPLPLDMFGVFVGRKAELKLPK